jgi:hypothetical protein
VSRLLFFWSRFSKILYDHQLFRCLLGFAFPLFGSQMFDKLDMGPGNSLLGALAIILGIPFPVWLYFNGAALRAKNPLTVDSTKPKRL